MAFREVRDPETGELVIEYDAERDRIRYRNERGAMKERPLTPYRGPRGERDSLSHGRTHNRGRRIARG